jgi:hypothetical protein
MAALVFSSMAFRDRCCPCVQHKHQNVASDTFIGTGLVSVNGYNM